MPGNGQPKIVLGDESIYCRCREIDPFDATPLSGARRALLEEIRGTYPWMMITIYDGIMSDMTYWHILWKDVVC